MLIFFSFFVYNHEYLDPTQLIPQNPGAYQPKTPSGKFILIFDYVL